MKSNIFILILLFFAFNQAFGQKKLLPTDSIQITGKVKNPTTFTLDDLDSLKSVEIDDLIIYNHSGEIKDTLTEMRGIPLKDLLRSIRFDYGESESLNEFYFVFVASDNYKVVFSWNEIYNTELSDNYFVVTQFLGKQINEMEQRILFLSTADLNSGRRFIQGLKKIELRKIE